MNLHLKVKMLEKAQKLSHEDAANKVLTDATNQIHDMDNKLAKAFEYLSKEQIKEIMGDMNE